jgi:polar amino acid transport system permease protein
MSLSLMMQSLGEGMLVTIQIFMLTLLFSMPLGLIISFGRMSKNIIIRNIVKIYISIMRGTPLILQLMVVWFAPYYLFGMSLDNDKRFLAVVFGFSMNYAAYFAEIYRGGIQSIPTGQYEAAQLLGYSKLQTFFKIIMPQMFKRVLPSVTNEVITLVKDTSLAFVISVAEMFTEAKAIAASQTSMTPYLIAGIFYYIFNLVVALLLEKLEQKMDYYK